MKQRSAALSIAALLVAIFVLAGWTGISFAQSESGKPAESSGESSSAEEDELIQSIGDRMGEEPEEQSEESKRRKGAALSSFPAMVLKTALMLAITLGALYLFALGLKHFLGKRGTLVASPQIQVLARSAISTKSSIYLVKVAGKVLVVGEAPSGLSLLSTVEESATLEQSVPQSARDDRTESPGAIGTTRKLNDFISQLGLSKARQSQEAFSQNLRRRTGRARELKDRIGLE